MTPEERFERIERQLEFIASIPAQCSAQIAENYKLIAEHSRSIAENSAKISQLADLTMRIGRIVEVQAGRLDQLAESERRTDERLSALISIFERYFSNGHK